MEPTNFAQGFCVIRFQPQHPSQKVMIFYKIAVVTPTERTEFAKPFINYGKAKEHFSKVCATYESLPCDAICILERNSLVVEAYRFTRLYDAYNIDGKIVFASKVLARRKSLSGMPSSPENNIMQSLRQIDLGDTSVPLDHLNLRGQLKGRIKAEGRSKSLIERLGRYALCLIGTEASATVQRDISHVRRYESERLLNERCRRVQTYPELNSLPASQTSHYGRNGLFKYPRQSM